MRVKRETQKRFKQGHHACGHQQTADPAQSREAEDG
jgi:hypothetical protein